MKAYAVISHVSDEETQELVAFESINIQSALKKAVQFKKDENGIHGNNLWLYEKDDLVGEITGNGYNLNLQSAFYREV